MASITTKKVTARKVQKREQDGQDEEDIQDISLIKKRSLPRGKLLFLI
jgi:hypothetical protein